MIASLTKSPNIQSTETNTLTSTKDVEQAITWSNLSSEQKATQAFMFGIGFSIISGIATTLFATLTAVTFKIEKSLQDQFSSDHIDTLPIYILPAAITAIFALCFFSSLIACCYGVAEKYSFTTKNDDVQLPKHQPLTELP